MPFSFYQKNDLKQKVSKLLFCCSIGEKQSRIDLKNKPHGLGMGLK
jgi:hypothetical protein